MVDFSKLRKGDSKPLPTEPRELYGLLPNKSLGRGNLWDVQAQVLTKWWERRNEPDLVIKVNTGGGKTTTGLVILQSVLNASEGPALYVAPDKYLAKQVLKEAKALGIATTDDPDSAAYLQGKAIGVVNAYKLVNGRSVFSGNRPTRPAAPIGTVIIDDAHAAIATTRAQLSLSLNSDNPAFEALLKLFKDVLHDTAPDSYLDVKEGIRGTPLRLPFWAWRERLDQARVILRTQAGKVKDDNGKEVAQPLYFSWQAMKDVLHLSHVVFGHDRVTVTAPCPPIGHISSLHAAKHKVFLTATLADDSVLVTDFGANADSVRSPIAPVTAGDIGERMILAPQEINPGIDASEVRDAVIELSKTYNTVVLVPSSAWAAPWKDAAAHVATADDVEPVVEELTSGKHVGLVVLIAKYDGIDLPQNACRVLVIDGLPESFSPEERDQSLLRGSDSGVDDRQIQRIEQGMGRGIRSNEDHCVVFLIGPRLAQLTVDPRTLPRFSPATRQQLAMSREVAAEMENLPLSRIVATAGQALQRDPEWVKFAKENLAEVPADSSVFSERALAERNAFEAAVAGDLPRAAQTIQDAAETEPDQRFAGALLEIEAEYVDKFDPARAQQLLSVARSKNPYTLRPLTGMVYTPLPGTLSQAAAAAERLTVKYTSAAAMLLDVEAIIESLRFDLDHTEEFEEALYELGRFIGLGSQRPEHELGSGPDNLWSLGENRFWVIEAKSGAVSRGIGKRDMGQLSQSMLWFGARYDAAASATPVMFHPSVAAFRDATPPTGMRVVTDQRLGELAAALRAFAQGLAQTGWTDAEDVARMLAGHKLLADELERTYTVAQRGTI